MEIRKAMELEQVKTFTDVVKMSKNLESYAKQQNGTRENYEIYEINFRNKRNDGL